MRQIDSDFLTSLNEAKKIISQRVPNPLKNKSSNPIKFPNREETEQFAKQFAKQLQLLNHTSR